MMSARLFSCVLFVTLLAGCECSSSVLRICNAFMDEVRARPKGAIEPLPKFAAYEPFTYQASNLRSPFQPPIKIDMAAKQKAGDRVVKPDETRIKQFLEGFNIETFDMVGTLSNDDGYLCVGSRW